MRIVAVIAALLMFTAAADAGPKKKKAKPTHAAVVLAIDRSGSMRGAKLDAAKAGAIAAVGELRPTDEVAVIEFDSEAHTFVRLQKASNRTRIGAEIARIQSSGGTDFIPALVEAHATLAAKPAKIRHMIVISDGESPTDGLAKILVKIRADKMTVSTVAVAGADETLLSEIATKGGGRMYKVDDLATLSQVLADETALAIK